MSRSAFLIVALVVPTAFTMGYSLLSQYQYEEREEMTLPISWKMDNENKIFGYQFEFGFNPCAVSHYNGEEVSVCLKPLKKAFERLPAYCTLFIKGFCASNYFFPNYEQGSSVNFVPAQVNPSSKAEVVVAISKTGFAEVTRLRFLAN